MCLNFGSIYPKLLISGGVDSNSKVLGDMWMLDSRKWNWKEVGVAAVMNVTGHMLCINEYWITCLAGENQCYIISFFYLLWLLLLLLLLVVVVVVVVSSSSSNAVLLLLLLLLDKIFRLQASV